MANAALALALLACGTEVTNQTPGSGGGTSSGTGSGGAGGGGDGYSAANLFTHVPRFIIFKADPTRNVCFRLFVEMGTTPTLAIETTPPWIISQADVTNQASDCATQGGFPPQPMSAAPAVSGTGTLKVEGTFPCSLSLHGTLSFEAQGPWVPTSEPLDVDALPVDGGCG
ncbi:MAG TPA: hypothetical protein VM694_41315 [Polyangium sp.]|nr:hypothetical protein [Polyangium sp.]